MTKDERIEMIHSYLADEGYVPIVDQEIGLLDFKYEGRTFVVNLDDDEDYVCIVCPYIWSIDSEEERARVVIAAHTVTAEAKVAKVYPMDDDTWASVEWFCSPPEAFTGGFDRSLQSLHSAVETFCEAMQE